ncbi:hypothetical protein EV702DRAFT_210399 [Suillus placidus]|uniref:Uncharacterized protein n=1 Tax=Suillus placidus TaxID=48579 RepID=A0A9P6ZH30_9AGAM|nr:hypothetical protein EV702DRAFT_210399 [Suillus placidus]
MATFTKGINMNITQEKIFAVLPPPITQSRTYSSVWTQCDFQVEQVENDATTMGRLKRYLLVEVDEKRSTVPLAAYCFMTGVVNALIFNAIFIWCGSQTGNSLQLSLAISRLLNLKRDYSFHLVDQQALCSVISFALAVFLGGSIGDKMGSKTRAWLFLGTFIQTLFTIASAIVMWVGRESSTADARYAPTWSDTLSFMFTGFLSASMGLQGVMARRVNTHFGNTVALTAAWVDLMADPKLLDIRRLVPSRDHRILTIFCFVLGGFAGHVSLDKIGSARTLAITAGIRFAISIWWLLTPGKDPRL